MRILGAMPPPGYEWEMGATAGSISFVRPAERWLDNTEESPQKVLVQLVVDLIKSHKLVVVKEITIDDFLSNPFSLLGACQSQRVL